MKVFIVRIATVAMALSAIAQAAPVIWQTRDLTFSDGATGAGYFILDSSIQQFSSWDITTDAASFSGFTYTPQTSLAIAGTAGCGVEFVARGNSAQFLCLNPASPLVAGATPALLGTSVEGSSGGQRFVAGGVLDDPPPCNQCGVPEPSSSSLLSIGILTLLALLGCWRFALRPRHA